MTATACQPPTLQLTQEQRAAVDSIVDWFMAGDCQVFRLHGYAGTGKTTVLQEVVRRLRELNDELRLHYAAPTGKAAQVMRSKGLDGATTLHANGLWQEVRVSKRTGRTYFHPLGHGKAVLDNTDLLIVDECSMVRRDLAARVLCEPDPSDLFGKVGPRRQGLRVLAVGDPAQLWPVPDRGMDKEASPWAREGQHDARLETIHRSAEGSVILAAAHAVRGPVTDFGAMRRMLTEQDMTVTRMLAFDQVIAFKNQTRWHCVNLLRAAKGQPAGEPASSDRLVLLRNGEVGVNGEQFEVQRVLGRRTGADDRGEEFDYFSLVLTDGQVVDVPACAFVDYAGEERAKSLSYRADVVPMTFADAVTCHKAQGSEWDSVLVVDEGFLPSMTDGWHYTAITRARQYVGLVQDADLPDRWNTNEARPIRDQWWTAVWESDLSETVKVTALTLVEAMTDEDATRVRVDLDAVADAVERSVSTVKTHMTELRKAGWLAGKGAMTTLAMPNGLTPPATLRQLHALVARQAVAG
jgi:exodeoxyribonuclease-5